MPIFSVILPYFNNQNSISAAIESVRKQTVKDWELIIVNDGSYFKLQLEDIFREDARIKTFEIKHKGRSAARNYGIQQANGQYISFLDADDQFTEQHLSNFMSAINQQNYKGQVILASMCLKRNGFADQQIIFPTSIKEGILRLIHKESTGISFCYPKKYSREFQFSTKYSAGEDKHLLARLVLKHGYIGLSRPTYLYNKGLERLGEISLKNSLDNHLDAMSDLYDITDNNHPAVQIFNSKESETLGLFRAAYVAYESKHKKLALHYLQQLKFSQIHWRNKLRYIKRRLKYF